MGTHFFLWLRAHCWERKKRKKDGKLVQWTEELPCFAHECKEQGSVIFFSPQDSSGRHAAFCGYSNATYYSYAPWILICKTAKKNQTMNVTNVFVCCKIKEFCISHNFFRGLKCNSKQKERPHFGISFLSPDECQCFLENDWQLNSHENKRSKSKCKNIDLKPELKKKKRVGCWQRAPNNRLAK